MGLSPGRRVRVLSLAALAGCSLLGPDLEEVEREVAGLQVEMQEGFRLLKHRCSRCHSPAEAFAAHVPAGSWGALVRIMARKPGAGIPSEDARRISAFLERYFDPGRPRSPAQ